MQIVIDLDERIYNICKGAYKKGCKDKDIGVLAKAIGEGTILPDNHGRLIDADIAKEKMGNLDGMGMIGRCLDEIPTVIESTKGEWLIMLKLDNRQRLFDLHYGDRFMFRGLTLEVISPYEISGIIDGLTGVLLPWEFKDTTVYCVDVNHKVDIYPFNTNYLVHAYWKEKLKWVKK